MATETLYIGSFSINNGLLTPTNAIGSTASTWTTNTNLSSWNATGEMDNPVGNTPNGSHLFRARVRKETGSLNPTFQMQVQDATGAVLGDSGVVTITSLAGQNVDVNVDATVLAAASGGLAGIRVYLIGTTSGGTSNSARSTPQLDYVSWSGDFTMSSAPPVANAGPDQNVTTGATVNLDGTGSTDDIGIVSWLWQEVGGSGGTSTIVEDASSPAVVRGDTSPLTTAAFSPPTNSVLVAVVTGDWDASVAMYATLSDSGSHQWYKVAEVGPAGKSLASIWICPLVDAPGSITVTASIFNLWQSTNTGQLSVKVLTGAALDQTGAAFATAENYVVSITPTVIGSVIYGGLADGTSNTNPTALAGTTFIDNYAASTFDNITWKSTDVNVDLTQKTFGSAVAITAGVIAAVEILPAVTSSITLVNPTTSTPSFTAPTTPGDYTFQLTVTDGEGQTSTDTVIIHVTAPSTGPTVAIWDGVTENPATIAVWNGATEATATLELVP